MCPAKYRAPSRLAERSARAGHWVDSLRNSDVNRLWAELHRIVSNHPLVRASRSAGLLDRRGRHQCLHRPHPGTICATADEIAFPALPGHGDDRCGNRMRDRPDRADESAHQQSCESVIRRVTDWRDESLL